MPDEVPSQETNWEAELSAAFESDPDFGGSAEQPAPVAAPETPAGDPAPDVQPPAAPEAPAPAEPPAAPVDTFDGGEFNPDLLDPSLQPGWRQLQGAFTKKTQELAEQRKELEAMAQQFGAADPSVAAQALQLHTAISDPANWPALVAELQGLMETNGVQMPAAPAEPVAPAAPAVVPAVEVDDPELAPLMERINALQTQVDGFRAAQQEQAMIAQAEREHAARVAHFEAQETRIKELYPNYKESDWNAIYTAVPFFNGDLIAAQQHFESERQRHVEAYLAGKQGAQGATLAPPTAVPAAPADPAKPVWLRDVEEEAVEHLRALQGAGELDL